MIVYIIGIILIVQLFNLQIVNGKEFLEQSNSRLTREITIRAARGNIYDSTGNLIAGTKTKYSLELYRSKIENDVLNQTILNVINLLEKNGESYRDNFPIDISPVKYKYEKQESIANWLKNNKLEENLTAEEALNYFIEEYELQNYKLEEARKIISVRYGIQKERI